MVFKNGLTHQTVKMIKGRFQQVKTRKKFFFKDELGGKIMKEFVGLKAKTYAYLMDDVEKRKKLKEKKNV